MKNLFKNFVFIILIFLIVSAVFTLIQQPGKEKEISINQLPQDINQDKIKSVTVSGNN